MLPFRFCESEVNSSNAQNRKDGKCLVRNASLDSLGTHTFTCQQSKPQALYLSRQLRCNILQTLVQDPCFCFTLSTLYISFLSTSANHQKNNIMGNSYEATQFCFILKRKSLELLLFYMHCAF